MNHRRHLLILLGAAAFSPRAVLAQPKQAPILIGWLNTDSRELGGHYLSAFKEGLATLGWKEGAQYVLEERWANGRVDRLASLAEERAARKPAIIIAAPLTAVRAAAKAAPKTPIVIANGGDPVASGVVKSLARPGGMVTGVTSFAVDITAKYLELFVAAAPKLRRVGFLTDSAIVNRPLRIEAARRSVARHAVEAHFAEAASPEEIEPAISRLAKNRVLGAYRDRWIRDRDAAHCQARVGAPLAGSLWGKRVGRGRGFAQLQLG